MLSPAGWSEYRILAKDRTGKEVQISFNAASRAVARAKAKAVSAKQGWTQFSLQKKKNYAYLVRRGPNKYHGLQRAYSKEEVSNALKRLGFDVVSVRRSFNLHLGVSSAEVVSFIVGTAKLLEQKMSLSDVLQIMAMNIRDQQLHTAIREIINDLNKGTDSQEAFAKQGNVFGEETAMMLGIATKSGDVKSIFQSVAKFVERQTDFKKGLASSLILPAVTAVSLVGAIGYYVLFLIPDMMKMMKGVSEYNIGTLTAMSVAMSRFLQDNIWALLTLIISFTIAFYMYITSPRGKLKVHQYIVRLPYIGTILRNSSIEMFCRVLGIMYTTGENITAIQYAAEASRNKFLEEQIKTVVIPKMLKYGLELPKALAEAMFFSEMALSRFKVGAETGNVKETAIHLADYYELENRYAMKNLINVIEISISVIIMITMVFLTLLSSEMSQIKISQFY